MTDTPNNSNPIELFKIDWDDLDDAQRARMMLTKEAFANSPVLQQAVLANSLVNRFDGVSNRPMTERE
jgi:hypothetical protein